MKKFLPVILITCFILLGESLVAQPAFFKMYLDSSSNGINAHAMAPTADKGYMVAGKVNYNNALIIKLDSSGNILWNKKIGGTMGGSPEISFSSIIATNDTCFLLAGSHYVSGSMQDAFILKINASGDTLWSKTINESGWSTTLNAIQQTRDSGFVMTGTCMKAGSPYRIFIAKTNGKGNLIWANMISYGGENITGNSVKETTDSSYILAGTYISLNQILLAKVSANGNLLWSKKYSSTGTQLNEVNDMVFTRNNIYCYLRSNKQTIMKTDLAGNLSWTRSYQPWFPGPQCLGCPSPKLCKTSDNALAILFGSCWRGNITKIDSNGNELWSKGLRLIAIDIRETGNKGFAIIGNGPMCGVSPNPLAPQIGFISTDSTADNNNNYCVFSIPPNSDSDTLKTDSVNLVLAAGANEGRITFSIDSILISTYSHCVNTIPGIKEESINGKTQISPNPTAGIIGMERQVAKPAQLIIYNALGEKVYESEWNSTSTEIDMHKNAKGIYFYQIRVADGEMESGKIVLIN